MGDAEYSWKEGFTDAEINYLGPRSLQMVVTTMIGEHHIIDMCGFLWPFFSGTFFILYDVIRYIEAQGK